MQHLGKSPAIGYGCFLPNSEKNQYPQVVCVPEAPSRLTAVAANFSSLYLFTDMEHNAHQGTPGGYSDMSMIDDLQLV